jgi:hypothetical protein
MRRLLMMSVSCTLVVVCGCGVMYTKRMDKTYEELKYNYLIDQELMPVVAEGKLKDMNLYVRAPKKMEPAKEFTLGVVDAGKYDVEKTYFETSKAFMHVLARQKAAPAKKTKGAAPADAQAARGPFNSDIILLLKSVYGEDERIAPEKLKDDVHKKNRFKKLAFKATGANNVEKQVQVFLIKEDKDDVALIFEYLPADEIPMNAKIKYCLESFALGTKARNKYTNGAMSDDEAEAAGPGAAF